MPGAIRIERAVGAHHEQLSAIGHKGRVDVGIGGCRPAQPEIGDIRGVEDRLFGVVSDVLCVLAWLEPVHA